ncbi:HET domain-containing protein [Fusarium sp. Ph1]|nr:HET domain-containing protein [Fusarium sp. Ph1]
MSIYAKHPLLPGQTHIRLLQIIPGSSKDDISCTITHASHGYLWCDSICIDQASDYERSHQVQLMNQIYRKAQSVLVWLGEARENSHITLRTIHLLSTCTDNASRAAYLTDRATVWQGLADLSKRRYWTRIWIVQEITVARDAENFCGSEVILWSTFAAACKSPPHHLTAWGSDLWAPLAEDKAVGDDGKQTKRRYTTSELFHSTMYGLICSQRRWPTQMESFATLYERYKDSGCEDGRDRIFALLGIATEVAFERGYTVEYHMTKEDTFVSLVAWGGKGAVKINCRIQFARLTAEAMELTWPHYQLESSLESESQRSPSFFKWVHQPLAISLRCHTLGEWWFDRQLETTGATIFRSDSRAEVHLPSDTKEHDGHLDLHLFGFKTSEVLLACQVTRGNSWTVVSRAYYASKESRGRQRVPSVFKGLNVAAGGAGGFGVQLENVAQFMEIFLDKRDLEPP